jgi:homoserine O-succinyltransferase/O-acetyltransferase
VVVVASDSGTQGCFGLPRGRPLRVGVVNIMPRAETYEPFLVRPLARAELPVALAWIRLRSHRYSSSDAAHIERNYIAYDEMMVKAPLDGLVLTGAPVEELAFRDVHYWGELCEILEHCRREDTSVLGICWGGLALARQLGIEKCSFEKKLFGVFEEAVLDLEHPILGGSDDVFRCTHSRHSGIRSADLQAARDAGVVRLLSHGSETGYSVFESADRRLLMHLGHPEYEAARLVHEWARDSAAGRGDVAPPKNFDLAKPINVWRSHCNDLFARWLQQIARSRRFARSVDSISPQQISDALTVQGRGSATPRIGRSRPRPPR